MSSPNSAKISPGMRLRISNFEIQRFLCLNCQTSGLVYVLVIDVCVYPQVTSSCKNWLQETAVLCGCPIVPIQHSSQNGTDIPPSSPSQYKVQVLNLFGLGARVGNMYCLCHFYCIHVWGVYPVLFAHDWHHHAPPQVFPCLSRHDHLNVPGSLVIFHPNQFPCAIQFLALGGYTSISYTSR